MSLKFRELIHPGANFEFIGRSRTWLTISLLVTMASIALLPINHFVRGSMLNWTIDFKGGTEITVTFPEKKVTSHEVREAMQESGHKNVDVSTFVFKDKNKKDVEAYLIRVPEFGAVSDQRKREIRDAFYEKFGGPDKSGVRIASWSGDNFSARTTTPIPEAQWAEFFKSQGLQMKAWADDKTADRTKSCAASEVGLAEYPCSVAVYGLDRNVQNALSEKLHTQVKIEETVGVGAKAGEELRNEAVRALLYAIIMIMLYIALRFDFRYGPGTVAALLHDAIVVVGVFAATWTEFSLTTVAAVLTVIGFSMNDTVVVFDRIRENEHKLKDKKFDRVINISINETLSRTLLTSTTVFLTTLAMNIWGTGLVKNFAFAMNVGIIVGTYSSIFVAAPILLWLNERYFSKRPTTTTRRIPATTEI
jgi:preprotein translocase subunit SecF